MEGYACAGRRKAQQVQNALETLNGSQPLAPASSAKHPPGSSHKNGLLKTPEALVNSLRLPDPTAPLGSFKAASTSSLNPAAALQNAQQNVEGLKPALEATSSNPFYGYQGPSLLDSASSQSISGLPRSSMDSRCVLHWHLSSSQGG